MTFETPAIMLHGLLSMINECTLVKTPSFPIAEKRGSVWCYSVLFRGIYIYYTTILHVLNRDSLIYPE
jgi:hypothetical protein